jgi:OFA family oxalate/formate antiporter-like MFS transporter
MSAALAKKASTPSPVRAVAQSRVDFTPLEMLRKPVFWVMYAMFVMVAAGGLMATAQLGPIARDFHIEDTPVSLAGIVLPALTFALALDRVLNGLTRPFFGWVSDQIGRERTMFIAFGLEAIGILALQRFGHHPVAFVILTGLVFFAWGEIYSLFPSTCTDTFGAKYATTNAGALYTAKGTASLLVPLSSVLTALTGNWHAVFLVASALNGAAALMAWFVLRPMRRAHIDAANRHAPTSVEKGVTDPQRVAAAA